MIPTRRAFLLALAALAGILACDPAAAAQHGRRNSPAGPGTVADVKWSPDGKAVFYTSEGQRYRLDLTHFRSEAADNGADHDAVAPSRAAGQGSASTGNYVGSPVRGRQYTQVDSPDGKWEAHYRDWNLVLVPKDGGKEVSVTTDGNESIHFGTASWVYGEELDQRTAMWWTPDSSKLLYYRFDDSGVTPFHLVTGWTEINTTYYPEFYPKAGAPNPAASLLVYDLATKKSRAIDAGGGSEEYLYGVIASPDGSTMMVHWTDRLQHDMKLLAMDLKNGKCRTVVAEHQDTWQDNSPWLRFLADGRRFLWQTDKSGYTHYELRDLDGKLLHPVTAGEFQTGGIDFIDEEAGLVGFTAYSSPANPYFLQYHLVGLDGKKPRRVTSLELHHSNFALSPDGAWLVAQAEDVDVPPVTVLYRAKDGERVATLAEADPASAAGLAEMFHFPAADGSFEIYGVLYKPADFDPARKYPVIHSLYAGPGSVEFDCGYVASARRECERGYLLVNAGSRGSGNRGKAFLGATYLRLGVVEMGDQADAIRFLRQRPYVDGDRVGIIGISYGGYMAGMGVFQHPDVYAAAVIGSAVTDWRNYDTIYTERYMSTPQLNPEGYRAGSVMSYVDRFRGHALITHGMIDDNVHPNNAFQLIEALDQAGKPYESRFWPNVGHGLGSGGREAIDAFFDRWLKQ